MMAWLGTDSIAEATPDGAGLARYEGGGWYCVLSPRGARYLVADLRHARLESVAKRAKRYKVAPAFRQVAAYQTRRGTKRAVEGCPMFRDARRKALVYADNGKGCLIDVAVLEIAPAHTREAVA